MGIAKGKCEVHHVQGPAPVIAALTGCDQVEVSIGPALTPGLDVIEAGDQE
jgi:hypothetical protein